jgi:hypothetical protein
MSFETVRHRSPLAGLRAADAEAFWYAVRGNLAVFAEVNEWIPVVFGKIETSKTRNLPLRRGTACPRGPGTAPLSGAGR